MHTPREGHSTNLVTNFGAGALVAGGVNFHGLLSSAEFYNIATSTWKLVGSMMFQRAFHRADVLRDGRIIVSGGFSTGAITTATAELFDPCAQTWTTTGKMNYARAIHTLTTMEDGRVLVAGGLNNVGWRHHCMAPYPACTTASAEIWDPERREGISFHLIQVTEKSR
jgi:hypothetical protein